MDEASVIKLGLRYRRTSLTDKTKLKESASRRKTFAAALQQFEEQMNAAKVVSAATRPINLYYGLVQAGLAMTAAHASGTWTFDKHGLKVLDMQLDIPAVAVRSDGKGAFQAIADATGSRQLRDEVTLGAVWNSIPELAELPLEGAKGALAVEFLADSYTHVHGADTWSDDTTSSIEYLRASVWVNEQLPAPEDRRKWLEDFASTYPGLQGAALWGSVEEAFRETRPPRFVVELCWPAPRQGMQEEDIEEFFDAKAPAYRYLRDRFVRPSLEAKAVPPSPLMSWWLLLYSFSMLARYQPRKWAEALDIDKSSNAAALEYALDVALDVIPHLVLEGLDQTPVLLSKPLAL